MALLTLGKNIMTIENAKGPILVNVLFWVGLKKNISSKADTESQRYAAQGTKPR